MTHKKRPGRTRKVGNSLMALSSAAVLGVYTAGFVRTRAAAQRFAEADVRRAPMRAQVPPVAPPSDPLLAPPPADAAKQPAILAPQPAATAKPPAVLAPARSEPLSSPSPSPAPARRPGPRRSGVGVRTSAAAAPSNNASEPAQPAHASATPPPAVAPSPAAASAPGRAAAPEVPAATPAPVSPTPVPPVATPPPAAAAVTVYKDGTYTGWGTSRHGDIQATVVIENGRIASASISQCYTRYPCSWIVALPPQVAQRQSPEVDYVSGATQSTNAFYYGVIEALAKAK